MDQLNPNNLPDLDLTSLEEELRQEEKYGDRPLEALGSSALSSATFGLSDKVLVDAGADPEEIAEVRRRSPVASGVGTVGGIVGPALLSGGTSLAAKGASAGIRGATAVGSVAEKAALAGLKKIAPTAGPKTALLAGQAARGAAEGSLAGLGQEISETALENKELTGEAALAAAGSGALLGAGFGTLFGAAQATVPTISSKTGKLSSKVGSVLKQGIDPLTDPTEGALRLVTSTAAKRGKVRDLLGRNVDELPDYLKTNLELGPITTTADLARKNQQVLQQTGELIGDTVKSIDNIITQNGTSISRARVYQPLLNKVDEIIEELSKNPRVNRANIKIAQRYKDDIVSNGTSEAPFSFKELDDLRKNYASKKFKGGGALESFEANLADDLRFISREQLNAATESISDAYPDLATTLKRANKTYHIGATINDALEEAAERQPNFTKPIDWAVGTAGRTARNLSVITDLAEKTANLQASVQNGVAKFFSKVKPGKIPTGGVQALLNTGFAINTDTGKAPKTRNEAFDNISKNIQEATADQDSLIELMAKRTIRIGNADPAVSMAMQTTLANAVSFLASKLPKSAVQQGLYSRKYQPSSMELAKFERYVQIIENPLTALEDLQRGTLTREHVEALKAVYPAIYSQIQQTAMDNIVEHPNLSYAKKVQLGILLDIPADSSMSPDSVVMLQQSIGSTSQDQVGSEGGVRAEGMDDVDIAGRASTEVQDVEADEP